jgi:tRNA nucleotidyltransferase/poly(A) polymerase
MLNRLQDVFKCLKEHKVKYLVIGGIAAVLYGVPRATFDLDILIEATPKNVQKLLDALLKAGLFTATLTSVDKVLAAEVTVFKDRVRIDVQTSTPGLKFKDAWKNKKIMQYRQIDFYVVSKSDLIASKIAAGRKKDLEDVQVLQLDHKE